MHDLLDVARPDAGLGTDFEDSLDDPARLVLRRARNLVHEDPATAVRSAVRLQDEIGERPPDINADSRHRTLSPCMQFAALAAAAAPS